MIQSSLGIASFPNDFKCAVSFFLKHIFADVTLNTIFWDYIFHRKQMSAIIPFLTSETYQSQIGNHPIRRAIIIRRKVIIIWICLNMIIISFKLLHFWLGQNRRCSCSQAETTGARRLCLLFWDLTHRLPQWPWSIPSLSCLVHPGLHSNTGCRGVVKGYEVSRRVICHLPFVL